MGSGQRGSRVGVNTYQFLAYCKKNIMKMCLLAKGTKMAATQSDVIPPPPPLPAPINLTLTQHHQSDRCYNHIFNALICGH